MMNRILLLSIFSLSVAVAACSGGDGGNSNSSSSSAASTERIVYMADQDINDVSELYLAGSSIKLNPPLSRGKNVLDFQITRDRTAVVYRADQDTNDVFELYRVEFANPGVSIKLNSPLPAGGAVSLFEITADSSSVVYVADQTTNNVFELYRVSFVTPGVSTKLNGPLVPGGNVAPELNPSSSGSFSAALARKKSASFKSASTSNRSVSFSFAITPDNSAVVYLATQDTTQAVELYRVPLATPGVSTKLNGVLPPNADVDSFMITPNNTKVVYSAGFSRELDSVAFATPGVSTKLNGPLPTGFGNEPFVGQYDITPDSSAVIYTTCSTGFCDFRFLYRVPFATPGQSTKLNGLGADRYIGAFAIRPDSSGVVYDANTVSPSIEATGTGLYLVPFASPGVSTQLNGPLVAGGGLASEGGLSFAIAPDNSSVVYVADEITNNVIEIYRVPFATPGVSTKLNGPLVADGGVVIGNFAITPDSSSVLYRADETTNDVIELYRVPLDTPGVSTKLNGPLTAGGNVERVLVQ